MSTRSQTRIYFGDKKGLTFYRHCDGYPEGHGCDLCSALIKAGEDVVELLSLLKIFDIEVEAVDAVHSDVEYIYEVTLPLAYEYYPDGRPEPYVSVHHVRSNVVVYEGTAKEVRMAIVMGKAR